MRSSLLLPILLAAWSVAHAQSPTAQPMRIATPALRMAPAAYPAGAEAREQHLLAQLSPSARDWVAREGRQLGPNVSAQAARAAVRARFPTLSADTDIDTLVFLVMMACAHESQAELREQLTEMQAVNRGKQAQREATGKARDTKSDMSEMERADLQADIERSKKALETLSNLMKKISETTSTLVSNVK